MSTRVRCRLSLAVFAVAGLLPASARGDVLPPEPKTHWEKGKAPNAPLDRLRLIRRLYYFDPVP